MFKRACLWIPFGYWKCVNLAYAPLSKLRYSMRDLICRIEQKHEKKGYVLREYLLRFQDASLSYNL